MNVTPIWFSRKTPKITFLSSYGFYNLNLSLTNHCAWKLLNSTYLSLNKSRWPLTRSPTINAFHVVLKTLVFIRPLFTVYSHVYQNFRNSANFSFILNNFSKKQSQAFFFIWMKWDAFDKLLHKKFWIKKIAILCFSRGWGGSAR